MYSVENPIQKLQFGEILTIMLYLLLEKKEKIKF